MKSLAKWLVLLVVLSGCASKEYAQEYVDQQLKPINARVDAQDRHSRSTDAAVRTGAAGLDAANKRIDDTTITLQVHADRLTRNEADIAQISRTAREALERAAAAGKLAEGRMGYEVVLSDDKVKFGSDQAKLGKDAMRALDEFVAKVKNEGKAVYVEVQGHTDSTGGAAHNLKVGQRRADTVLRYLHEKGLPLFRLSAISYGESMPVVSNHTREGRARNRRVVLVVLY